MQKSSMKSHIGIWVLLTGLALVAAVDHTHINNLSGKNICATISYWIIDSLDREYHQTGSSKFVSRQVTVHNSVKSKRFGLGCTGGASRI